MILSDEVVESALGALKRLTSESYWGLLADQVKQNKARFAVVRLEQTQMWKLDTPLHPDAKIFGVYLVDLNEVTHCCEVTPSYCLHFLYNTGNLWLTDEQQEEVMSMTDEERCMYMHCSAIDRLPVSQGVEGSCMYVSPAEIDSVEALEESYDKLVESLIETYNANHIY